MAKRRMMRLETWFPTRTSDARDETSMVTETAKSESNGEKPETGTSHGAVKTCGGRPQRD